MRSSAIPESSGRPQLLFLSQTLPFPPDVGGKIRTYHLLRLLSRSYEVTAFCFYREADTTGGGVEAAFEHLAQFATVRAYSIPQEKSTLRLLMDHARSVMTRRPYTVFTYESREFRSELKAMLAAVAWDVVHMDSLDLSTYLPALKGLPVVCGHHNVESELLSRRSRFEISRLRGSYLRHQAVMTRRVEEEWCPRVSLNICVSEGDVERLHATAPLGRFAVIPNGVDISFFSPRPTCDNIVVFMGSASWSPNVDAMRWFCDRVLPHLRKLVQDVQVHWVGRMTPPIRQAFAPYGIVLHGWMEDIRPLVARAAVVIAPLRMGGGTRLKILDGWAMGKAVVATSLGCEGLATEPDVNIMIRDEPESFAMAIEELISHPQRRDAIGSAARDTVEMTYDWERIGRKLQEAYDHATVTSRQIKSDF